MKIRMAVIKVLPNRVNSKFFMSLFLLLMSVSAFAAFPTPEGLFRNSNNKELTGNFIVLKFMVDQEKEEQLAINNNLEMLDSKEVSSEVKTEINKTISPKFYKVILSKEIEKRTDVLQLEYDDKEMGKDSLVNLVYMPHFYRKIDNEAYLDRSLMYSLLTMFALNESDGIVSLISRISSDFKKNKEILNDSKVDLLERYKDYLVTKNEDPSLEEDLVSPLKPVDESEGAVVQETMKQNMYQKVENIKLVRINHKFFWEMHFENLHALFSNENHRLVSLKLTHGDQTIEINCGDYILFDGVHELPKTVFFKDSNNRRFKIRMLTLSNFTNRGKKLHERMGDYQKHLDELNKRKPIIANLFGGDDSTLEANPFLLY